MNLHFCDWGRKGVHGEVVKCVSFYHTGKEHQKYTISILIYQKSLSLDDHRKSFLQICSCELFIVWRFSKLTAVWDNYKLTKVSLYLVSTCNFSLTLLYIDTRSFHFIWLNVASLVTTSESNRVMLMKQFTNHN